MKPRTPVKSDKLIDRIINVVLGIGTIVLALIKGPNVIWFAIGIILIILYTWILPKKQHNLINIVLGSLIIILVIFGIWSFVCIDESNKRLKIDNDDLTKKYNRINDDYKSLYESLNKDSFMIKHLGNIKIFQYALDDKELNNIVRENYISLDNLYKECKKDTMKYKFEIGKIPKPLRIGVLRLMKGNSLFSDKLFNELTYMSNISGKSNIIVDPILVKRIDNFLKIELDSIKKNKGYDILVWDTGEPSPKQTNLLMNINDTLISMQHPDMKTTISLPVKDAVVTLQSIEAVLKIINGVYLTCYSNNKYDESLLNNLENLSYIDQHKVSSYMNYFCGLYYIRNDEFNEALHHFRSSFHQDCENIQSLEKIYDLMEPVTLKLMETSPSCFKVEGKDIINERELDNYINLVNNYLRIFDDFRLELGGIHFKENNIISLRNNIDAIKAQKEICFHK